MTERIISPESLTDDGEELTLRPASLDAFIGQDQVKAMLKIAIEAAKIRDEPLDHILFSGPPGLGKTTLAYIIAHEMGVNIRCTSGPILERVGDLAAILTNLSEGEVFFIDEIHRLNRLVEEALYPVMEDFELVRRLGRLGRIAILPSPVRTSARRWHRRYGSTSRASCPRPRRSPCRTSPPR